MTGADPDRRRRLRPLTPRDPHEPHRVATPLELLVDLCFVVAVAQVAARLHHGLAAGHAAPALLAYAMVFFSIWWAWMNFTWFASAYDNDDVLYRLMTLVQIAGVLIVAAGVPRGFDGRNFDVITLGYGVMRAGLVAQWLRAARADPTRRRATLRYAVGVSVCYAGWASLLLMPGAWPLVGWCVMVPAELFVPIWAERRGMTPWHPHHIAERYSLLTLIVLGESVLAATLAIQSAVVGGGVTVRLGAVIAGGLLIIFSMWWLYFERPAHQLLVSGRRAFLWGYGHLLIFSSAAAVGAGLAVAVDHVTGRASIPARVAGASIAIPVSVYLLSLWAMHLRPHGDGPARSAAFPVAALLVPVAAMAGWPALQIGLLLAGLVAFGELSRPRHSHD